MHLKNFLCLFIISTKANLNQEVTFLKVSDCHKAADDTIFIQQTSKIDHCRHLCREDPECESYIFSHTGGCKTIREQCPPEKCNEQHEWCFFIRLGSTNEYVRQKATESCSSPSSPGTLGIIIDHHNQIEIDQRYCATKCELLDDCRGFFYNESSNEPRCILTSEVCGESCDDGQSCIYNKVRYSNDEASDGQNNRYQFWAGNVCVHTKGEDLFLTNDSLANDSALQDDTTLGQYTEYYRLYFTLCCHEDLAHQCLTGIEECMLEMNYYDAKDWCNSQGARLCNKEELKTCCADTCHDKLVWSSSPLPSQQFQSESPRPVFQPTDVVAIILSVCGFFIICIMYATCNHSIFRACGSTDFYNLEWEDSETMNPSPKHLLEGTISHHRRDQSLSSRATVLLHAPMALRQGFDPFSNLSTDYGECQTPQSQNFSPDPKSLQATLEEIEAELRTEFEENDNWFREDDEQRFIIENGIKYEDEISESQEDEISELSRASDGI